LNLSFREKTKNLLAISGYIAAGGIGSLLIVFLLRKSFSFNNSSARKYHHQVRVALQEAHQLEKELLELKFAQAELFSSLKPQNEAVIQAIVDLKNLPEFLSKKEQNLIDISLEDQESLLFAQSELIERFQTSQKDFAVS